MSGSVNSDSDESSVYSEVDESLRADYHSYLAKKYINPKSLKSTNRGWKTEKEINVLYGRVRSRNAFEDAKRAGRPKKKSMYFMEGSGLGMHLRMRKELMRFKLAAKSRLKNIRSYQKN